MGNKENKLAAAIINTVCSRQKPISDSELCCKFCIENNLNENFREMKRVGNKATLPFKTNQGINVA